MNADYWSEKIARNVARDRDTDARLAESGWIVIRFWEHEAVGDVALSVESRLTDGVDLKHELTGRPPLTDQRTSGAKWWPI